MRAAKWHVKLPNPNGTLYTATYEFDDPVDEAKVRELARREMSRVLGKAVKQLPTNTDIWPVYH